MALTITSAFGGIGISPISVIIPVIPPYVVRAPIGERENISVRATNLATTVESKVRVNQTIRQVNLPEVTPERVRTNPEPRN